MKKYILVDIFEREMALPLVFDTAEAATNALVEGVAEVLEIEPDIIQRALNASESYAVEDVFEVTKTSAWANIKQGRYDAMISVLDTEIWKCVHRTTAIAEREVCCLNCGHTFRAVPELDDLGWHCACPECTASFDVDKEVEGP